MKEKFYFLFIAVIITITAIISLILIRQGTKTGYVIVNPPVKYETSETCPCENVGFVESGCKVYFLLESDDPSLNVVLRPNYEQLFDGMGICIPATNVKINSHRFRDHEYPLKKPANVFRIVVLGDSLTFGHGIELNQTYSKVLEILLNGNDENDNRSYEVMNFGVPSYNMVEKIEILRSKAIKFNPDMVILQYHGDDIVNWTEFRNIEKIKIEEYAESVGKNKENVTKPELYLIHTDAYREYLDELIMKSEDEVFDGIEQSFEEIDSIIRNKAHFLLIVDGQRENELSLLKKISNSKNWTMLNLKETFEVYPRYKIEIHPKDQHPTAFANELIAKELYEEISSKQDLYEPKQSIAS